MIADHVCAVADGMGGHAAGDVAATLVTRLVADVFNTHGLHLDELPDFISALNAAVRRTGAENGTRTMGTTLVGVACVDTAGGPCVVVFNVGDSRCYRLADGQLSQITKDHSHVQDLVDGGHITPVEAETHAMRNVITRALGADDSVEADYVVLPPAPCRLLLCSDGLSGELPAVRIESALKEIESPEAAASTLIDAVLEGPAPDNITAIVVDVDDAGIVDVQVGDGNHAGAAASTLPPPGTAPGSADITSEPPFDPPAASDRQWGPPSHPAAAPPGEAP